MKFNLKHFYPIETAILVVVVAGTVATLGGSSTAGQSGHAPPSEVVTQDDAADSDDSADQESDLAEEATDETAEEVADETVAFEYDGEFFEYAWFDVPGGTFEIALPTDVENLDLEVTDSGTISIWDHERDVLAEHADNPDEENLDLEATDSRTMNIWDHERDVRAEHADNPDEVPLRGRIFVTSKTIDDPRERSTYRENFGQSLSESVDYDHREGGNRTFGDANGSYQNRTGHVSGTDRSRSFEMVEWTIMRFEVERDATVWNFVLLAPETETETFESLFIQALETIRQTD